MDFSIGTEDFQRVIKSLGVITRINAEDSTGRILIEAFKDKVVFLANNGDTALFYTSKDAEVKEPGTTSITYSKVKSFVSSFRPWNGNFGAKTFRLKLNSKTLTINVDNTYENGKISKGNLKLTTFDPRMIPKPDGFGEPSFLLNSTIFRHATNKVMYAINPATDFNFGALQGMNIQFEEQNIYFAGADGRVLSEYQVKNVSDRKEGNITLQYDFIMGLRRLLMDDTQLFWEILKGKIRVKFENMVFIGRQIVGHEYPDYRPTFSQFEHHININKDVLVSNLSPFVDLLSPEDNFRVTLELKGKLFRLYNDQADIEVELEIENGLDFVIDVNGKLLMNTIEVIRDDYILMKFSTDSGVLIFDSSTFEDQKALIVPLKRR